MPARGSILLRECFGRLALSCGVQREAQAVVTGEHEGRATGGDGAKMPFILPIRLLRKICDATD